MCHNDLLVLDIRPTSSSALNEMLTFFEHISEKSKALVRTEARIFVSSNPQAEPAEDWAEELVTTLLTDHKPRVTHSQIGLEVELSDVRGLTPSDQSTWVNLVTEIWPQLPS